MKQHDRPFWILLIIGIALRLVALNQPLVDSHLLRQVQTAAATKSLIEQPGFPLSSQIPWLGNLDARYIQELPLYNYLVIPVYKIIGHLDASGKLVSVALWALSFWLLQKIWRRILIPQQTFWANLLFVVAPVGVFYATSRPTFEGAMNAQLAEAKAKQGPGDVAALLKRGDIWTVH